MSQIRISISKTNYDTAFACPDVDAYSSSSHVLCAFTPPPTLYTNFERGQKVLLNVPTNPDWNGEYFIQYANHLLPYTYIHLRFRNQYIQLTPPVGTVPGTVYTHSYIWNYLDTIVFDGKIKVEREEGFIFGRKKLSKALTFKDEAYTFLKELKNECNPYLIYIRIERKCGKVWEEEYIGAFTINDVKWDAKKCIATVTPFTSDNYQHQRADYSKQFNLLETTATRYKGGFSGGTNAFGQRFLKLADVLDFYLKKCMPNVRTMVSNFFSINSTGYVYPVVIDTANLTNVMIESMSDANNPSATTPATIMNLSMADLMKALRTMFNVYWDVIDDVFYLEHEYFFTQNIGLNTVNRILNYNDISEYDTDKVPKTESFKFAQGENTDYFQSDIIYNDNIINNQRDGGETKIYEAINACTDFGWVSNVAGGASIANVPSNNGFMIGAFNPAPSPNGDYHLAVNMQWRYLIPRFHAYKRPYIEGYFYQGAAAKTYHLFESTVRTVMRDGVIAEYCCDDPAFNINDLVETEWGDAEVESAEIDLHQDKIQLKIYNERQC